VLARLSGGSTSYLSAAGAPMVVAGDGMTLSLYAMPFQALGQSQLRYCAGGPHEATDAGRVLGRRGISTASGSSRDTRQCCSTRHSLPSQVGQAAGELPAPAQRRSTQVDIPPSPCSAACSKARAARAMLRVLSCASDTRVERPTKAADGDCGLGLGHRGEGRLRLGNRTEVA
jgi:hypothetical protein